MTERCAFRTTTPKGGLLQSARGRDTRYEQCKNRATHTITVTYTTLRWTDEREVRCCGLHKRLHDERGWMP